MPCFYCQAGMHNLCIIPADDMCCCTDEVIKIESSRGGPLKNPEDMKDALSTGRKRAALAKPILPGMSCEWAYLAKAGGGVIPIMGCAGNDAAHIHHGPDKDTTNNTDLNLHRVCHECHNRWHSLNDAYYGVRPPAGTPFVPTERIIVLHDPESKVEVKDIYEHELWWSTSPKNRKPYVNQPVGEDND